MKHESCRRMVLGLFSGVFLAALLATPIVGQDKAAKEGADPPKKVEPKSPSTPSIDDPKERKRLRLRLPTYYGRVVTEAQREEIYGIQAKYNSSILKLKEELESLSAKRDSEVKAVLSEEQRAEVAQYWETRRGRGKGASGKEGKSPATND
ncbi:MAG: hypothetical protein ACQESR_26275 [Planctomycetota bacterium]